MASWREQYLHDALEDHFGERFEKVRPPFLWNPETGHLMELDMYSDKLKLAVEFNGYQHYTFPNRFHKTREEFDAQVRRDRVKVERCLREGILLVSIPEMEVAVSDKEWKHYRKWTLHFVKKLDKRRFVRERMCEKAIAIIEDALDGYKKKEKMSSSINKLDEYSYKPANVTVRKARKPVTPEKEEPEQPVIKIPVIEPAPSQNPLTASERRLEIMNQLMELERREVESRKRLVDLEKEKSELESYLADSQAVKEETVRELMELMKV